MINENENQVEETKEVPTIQEWNDACDEWDRLHDLHGLQDMSNYF